MHKVLIAHSSEDVRITLENIISCKYRTLTCSDCHQASVILEAEKPDALILDLSLHGGSAAELLKNTSYLPPIILATTWFPDEMILQEMTKSGVDHIMTLPGKLGTLIYLLEDKIQQFKLSKQIRLRKILEHLQIPGNLDGYKQLLLVVPMYMEDERQTLTKEIYPIVANQMDLNGWKCVDHSIRSALDKGWQSCGHTIWRQYFPRHTKRPSVSEFLAFLKNYLA